MTFRVEAMVRGYHCYQEIWQAIVGEELQTTRELGNIHDLYAVAVTRSRLTVGHLPRKISSVCSLFLRRGGEISCIVTGTRRYSSDLEQGGLEIPCTLIFKDDKIDDKKYLNKVHKPVREAMNPPSIKTSDCADSGSIKTQSMVQRNGNSPEPKKRKILLNDQNTNSSSDSWEHEIRNEQMLTNVSVTMAQDLLRSQFPSINGLYPTMDQYLKQPSHSGSNQLQVFHCRQRHHWIAASSIGCPDNATANIYNSVFTLLDSCTIDVIKNHFPSHTIKVQPFQKQLRGKDCGLFSIAAITAIAHGEDPSQLKFIQEEMRKHLFTCLKKQMYDTLFHAIMDYNEPYYNS
jgi:hypothetical protein